MMKSELFNLPVPLPPPMPDIALARADRQRGRDLAEWNASWAAGNFKAALKVLGLAEYLCQNPLVYGLLLLLRSRLNDAEFLSALAALGEAYLASLAAQKEAKAKAKAAGRGKKAAPSAQPPSAAGRQATGFEPADEPDVESTPEAAAEPDEPLADVSDLAPTAPDAMPEEAPVAPADETLAAFVNDLLASVAGVFADEEPMAPETSVAADVAVVTPEAIEAAAEQDDLLADISDVAPTAPDAAPEASPSVPVGETIKDSADLLACLAHVFVDEEPKAPEADVICEVADGAPKATEAASEPSLADISDVAPTAPDAMPNETPATPADEPVADSAADRLASRAHVFVDQGPKAPETGVASEVAVVAPDPARNVGGRKFSGAAVAPTRNSKPLRLALPPLPAPESAAEEGDEERTGVDADQSNAPVSTS